ncbi:MAG: ABC-F family ATP-binding cassette domain-containing protein [Bacilli bacterium]|nr:ABC-F family ATP-binding cassette domain-containing protein [Bacilli bacterium]
MKGTNLNLSFNLEKIYENANFMINDNDKVGVVGVNGAGKTTLFRVILKEIELDSGKISINHNKRVGYLPQEIILEDQNTTVFDYLLSARPIKQLEQELAYLYEQAALNNKDQNKILNKITKVQNSLEYYDYYNAENILLELISNMDIDSNLLDMKLNNLSGGQKSKIAFAHLLYSNPEILLLDEPTNHLDVVTREYITNYLKRYKGTILLISHDIEFLNAITNKIMFIDKGMKDITVYNGNYNDFMKKYERNMEFKERLIKKQEDEITKLRDIVLLYSNSSGKRKRMAQSREKTLAKKMETKIERNKVLKNVKLNIKPNREGSKIPLKVNNISFNYDNYDTIINNLSFIINNKERFLIVGENGVGKSTLLKLLVGELKPKGGNIWLGNKTDIAYYAQEQELLDQDKTVLENVSSEEYNEKELRTVLGSFLFYGDDAFKQVKVLSPGERARLSLCKIMLKKANLLLLDEATNHLDPDTQKIIAENFKNYDGTIILVSHNVSFVEAIGIDRMLILPSGKITNYSKEALEYYYKMNTI